MKSTTHLRKKIGRKTHPVLVETLVAARKEKAWRAIAHKLSGSTRTHVGVNLDYLEKHTKEGDTVLVTGKVLGTGILTKKIRICALSFSTSALTKLKNTKAEIVPILDEIKKNPKASGVRVVS